MITNHMTNSLIGPILIRNSRVSAKFKLRSTGLSSEISLLRIRRETVTGLDGGDDETETINDRILVYLIQKFTRIPILWCQCSKKYGRVKVDADLERWSANTQ